MLYQSATEQTKGVSEDLAHPYKLHEKSYDLGEVKDKTADFHSGEVSTRAHENKVEETSIIVINTIIFTSQFLSYNRVTLVSSKASFQTQ